MKPGRADKWISRENDRYVAESKLKAISIATFFEQYFCAGEYGDFLSAIDQYLEDAREIIDKSIKYFSTMNFDAESLFR